MDKNNSSVIKSFLIGVADMLLYCFVIAVGPVSGLKARAPQIIEFDFHDL